MSLYDINHDGLLSSTELAALYPRLHDRVYLIHSLDSNHDGYLDSFELTSSLKMTKKEVTDVIFEYYDSNKDGYLDKNEVT